VPGSVIAIAPMISPATTPGSQRASWSSVPSVDVGDGDVVLQREAGGHRGGVNPGEFLEHDVAVAVVRFGSCAAELDGRGQADDALLARGQPQLAVDEALLVPAGEVRGDLPGHELPHRLPVCLVIGLVQTSSHRAS
jgi:hypothetical protein